MLLCENGEIVMTLTRKKIHVSMHLSDGMQLNGTMVIERDTRLSDVLNNLKKDFVVMTDDAGMSHIINKAHIMKVVEISPKEKLLKLDDDDYLELPREA